MQAAYSPDEAAGQIIVVDDYVGLTPAEAQKKLKSQGITAAFQGAGETITAQLPAAGQSIPGDGQILLFLEDAPEQESVVVPDFIGMDRKQAAAVGEQLGLYIHIVGNADSPATVISQTIKKETTVPQGTTISLTFVDTKARD